MKEFVIRKRLTVTVLYMILLTIFAVYQVEVPSELTAVVIAYIGGQSLTDAMEGFTKENISSENKKESFLFSQKDAQ